MSVEILRTREQIGYLASHWNRALVRSAADSPFLRWEWITAWLDAVDGAVDPEVYVALDGQGEVIGIAPFCTTRLRLLGAYRYRCLRFMGEPGVGGEYADVVFARGEECEATAALAEGLNRGRPQWDCAWLPKTAGWGGAQERLAGLFNPGRFALRSRRCSFAVLPLPDQGTSFLEKASRNLRSALRRTQKQLKLGAPLRFACLKKSADVLPLLDTFASLHQKRWEGVGQVGAFRKRPYLMKFFLGLCAGPSERDWIRLCILRQGDVVVAAQFGVVYQGVYYQLQEGYDPASPPGVGNYLRWRSIDAFVEEGVRSYDFMAGYSEHKRRWGALEREGWDHFYVRRSARTPPIRLLPLWPRGRYLRLAGI